MTIKICKTTDEIAELCADEYAALLKTKPNAVLGFATGASPLPTYAELVRRCARGEISFRSAATFNLDEYCGLPVDDKNSYRTFMFANLFSKIDLPAENVHMLDGNAAEPALEAKRYDLLIEEAGGIDLQLLGIGTNGHIGFNEPDDHFTKHSFVVTLSQSTVRSNRIYFEDGVMPERAITMGIGSIFEAKRIVLIATGEKKAKAIKMSVCGPITPRCPASILQFHPNVLFLLDEAAAEFLPADLTNA